MSEFGSLLDALKMVDNRFLSAGELHDEIAELCRGLDQLQVQIADKTAALSESGGLVELGFPSVTAFLMDVGRMAAGRARRYGSPLGDGVADGSSRPSNT